MEKNKKNQTEGVKVVIKNQQGKLIDYTGIFPSKSEAKYYKTKELKVRTIIYKIR